MMKEGNTKKWKSSEYFNSAKLVPNKQVAYMGELIIGRSAGTLRAVGGPCPIIAVYRPDVHLGALLHVCGGDAEDEGDNHEELIDRLMELEEEISDEAVCHVILDEVPNPGGQDEKEEKKQAKARQKYAARMKKYLKEKGFEKVTVVFDGQGKIVDLDTRLGKLWVIDDDEDIAFNTVY